MGINLGLDIGAISLKLAALGKPGDRAILRDLCESHPQFRLTELAGDPLVLSDYRRIAGSPIQSTYDLLSEFYETVAEHRVEGCLLYTSSRRPRRCWTIWNRRSARRTLSAYRVQADQVALRVLNARVVSLSLIHI